MDPLPLGPVQWSEIGKLIVTLWIVVLFIVLLAANIIVGHNFIPSFVMSGHLSSSWHKARLVFYAFAIISFGLMLFFLSRVIDLAGVLVDVWDSYWI